MQSPCTNAEEGDQTPWLAEALQRLYQHALVCAASAGRMQLIMMLVACLTVSHISQHLRHLRMLLGAIKGAVHMADQLMANASSAHC